MSNHRPLRAEEIPEEIRKAYDIESQSQDNKGLTRIDRCCIDCGKKQRVLIYRFRSKEKTPTGRCQKCSRKRLKGDIHPMWSGGRALDSHGYVQILCPGHPAAYNGRYVPEHRLVIEAKLGRYLFPNETIHHRNGVRDDNRPENLEVWFSRHGRGQRYKDVRTEDLDAWIMEIEQLLAIREVEAGIAWG